MAEQQTDPNAQTKKKSQWRKAFSIREDDEYAISDARFLDQVDRLTKLRTFLLAEAIIIRDEHVKLFALGDLSQLWFSETGRLAKADEWNSLDERARVLSGYLTMESRKRLQLSETPKFVAWLPLLLIVAALACLVLAIFAQFAGFSYDGTAIARFICYLGWLICLGAIGAIAFVSMNALAIQSDATFDLTNKKLLAVRIVLGALFGVVLSIPFGFSRFLDFCNSVTTAAAAEAAANSPNHAAESSLEELFSLQAALLLLPFILGFSTSLVVLVLNRFVESISTFFGQKRDQDSSAKNQGTMK